MRKRTPHYWQTSWRNMIGIDKHLLFASNEYFTNIAIFDGCFGFWNLICYCWSWLLLLSTIFGQKQNGFDRGCHHILTKLIGIRTINLLHCIPAMKGLFFLHFQRDLTPIQPDNIRTRVVHTSTRASTRRSTNSAVEEKILKNHWQLFRKLRPKKYGVVVLQRNQN